ncbi:hypothetical protein MKW92_032137 [Papaver armeniacum]|nr:hypothetical protein MKW92_032137 [Papaver armeniacum]
MKSCISPNPNKQTRSKTKSSKENVPPLSSPAVATAKILSSVAKMKTPLPVPPRTPSSKSSNPLKRKVLMECVHENSVPESPSVTTVSSVGKRKCPLPPSSNSSCNSKGKVIMESVPRFLDTGVQVIVRIRPPNVDADDEIVVEKVSEESLSVLDHTFTFDYVADTSSSQKDVYQLIGAPFVENCLEGFNMENLYNVGTFQCIVGIQLPGDQHGLARVFEQLFSRMSEIYNEQITDLLDPKDVKAGVYVENLTEHGVCTMNDVRLLLIKGLANRRTGATNMNAESSRSHCLFTCTLTGAAGERLKESGNINRSLSQLGNVINILADVSQTGKQRHIPYRDSRLTFLLQESLGGNARLAMICAISPVQSSTLRFAQRAKAIKNKATVNEVTQGDVKVLQEMIHQLKMEIDEEAVEKLCTEVENHINEREVSESSQENLSPPLMEEADVNMEVCSKAVEKVLAGAIRREMALEEFCVQQYKGERDVLVAEVQHLRSQLS